MMKKEEKNWVLENYYRRLILELIKRGAKTEKEIQKKFSISLSPYLSSYKPKVKIKISPSSLKNHLNILMREGFVQKKEQNYYIMDS